MKKIILLFIFIISISSSNLFVFAEEVLELDEESFYLDAIIFKDTNPSNDSAKIDIFAVIPNKTLTFTYVDNKYLSKFSLYITITDINNKIVFSKTYNKKIVLDDYNKTLGTNSEFTKIMDRFYLFEGNYKIHAYFTDLLSKTEYDKHRNINVINFNKFPFSASGILLLSNIEETENGKYLITPHISDNIGSIHDYFFAFFEIYNYLNYKEIQIVSEVINITKDTTIYYNISEKNIKDGINQLYVRIPKENITYSNKNNILRITIKEKNSDKILAAAQRTIKNQSYFISKIIKDLPIAIKQLRYVATNAEIKEIESAKDENQQQKLFEEFWNKLDPTPGTDRNEALEEYYSRIEYANKNFKSYAEGWLTDKGNVYIVYGPPDLIENSNASYSSNRTYEKWTYYSNHVFLFYDASGFGDFRLSNPSFVSEKYKYNH